MCVCVCVCVFVCVCVQCICVCVWGGGVRSIVFITTEQNLNELQGQLLQCITRNHLESLHEGDQGTFCGMLTSASQEGHNQNAFGVLLSR